MRRTSGALLASVARPKFSTISPIPIHKQAGCISHVRSRLQSAVVISQQLHHHHHQMMMYHSNINHHFHSSMVKNDKYDDVIEQEQEQQQQQGTNKVFVSEVDTQRENFLDHLQSCERELQQFWTIVESTKDTGIGETLTDTPLQDKEQIMKQVIEHMREMVNCLEKIIFIEAADALTNQQEEPLIVESFDAHLETEKYRVDEDVQVDDKKDEFLEEFVEDDQDVEEDETTAPINSTFFQKVINVLQAISHMERDDVASSMATKVYDICARIHNEFNSAPNQLKKQPFFNNSALVKLNTDFFNQLLLTYALHGDREHVVIVLQDMKELDVKATARTYHALVQLAVTEGDFNQASRVMNYASQCGFQPLPETLALLGESQ